MSGEGGFTFVGVRRNSTPPNQWGSFLSFLFQTPLPTFVNKQYRKYGFTHSLLTDLENNGRKRSVR